MERSKMVSLWMVLIVVFIDWFGIGLVFPLFSSLLFHEDSTFLEAGTSPLVRGWYLGILLSAMSIGQFFSGPVFGTLSDQKGRKPLLVYTLMIAIFGYALSALSIFINSVVILMISRLIVGIAAGNTAVVNAAIADLSDPKNKTKNFGLLSMANGIGFTIGPFIGGYFSTTHYSIPFIIAGVAVILNLFLILTCFKETHHKLKSAKISLADGLKKFKHAFHIPHLRSLFLVILCIYFAWAFFYEFIPITWIALYNVNPAEIGLYYAYGAAVYSLSAGLLIRPILNRYKNLPILFYSATLLGTGILVLLIQPPQFWVWIYLPILNYLVALVFPTSTTMVSDLAKEDEQGEIMGMLNSLIAASFAISPLIAGFILGSNAQMPIILGGITLLLGSFFLYTSYKKELKS